MNQDDMRDENATKVEDLVKFVDDITSREPKVSSIFITRVMTLLETAMLVSEKLLNTEPPFRHPRGASRSYRRRKERRFKEQMSSIGTMPSIISQNSKLSRRNSSSAVAIKDVFKTDLSLNMKEPFVADVFKIEERENKNFYVVRERKSCPTATVIKKYIGKNQMIRMEKLNDDILNELTAMLEALELPGTVTRAKTAVAVDLDRLTEPHIFDIWPQIPVSSMVWKDCPDLVAIGEIPKLVQKTIRSMRELEDLVLFVPLVPKVNPSRYEEEIRNIVYNRVEVEFFLQNDAIAGMVRLVKLAYMYGYWLQFGLSEFHIHQIALREADSLCFKTKREGYTHILKSIKEELVSTTSKPDFFVKKVHFGVREEKISSLLKHIDLALPLKPTSLYFFAGLLNGFGDSDDDDDDNDLNNEI